MVAHVGLDPVVLVGGNDWCIELTVDGDSTEQTVRNR